MLQTLCLATLLIQRSLHFMFYVQMKPVAIGNLERQNKLITAILFRMLRPIMKEGELSFLFW